MIAGLVSTIVPVFNRPTLLHEAVSSVLHQTYRHFEVLLVDDGSASETAELCDGLQALDDRIRVIHLDHSGRPGLVREAGRGAARGEFVQYLDSDDLLLPRKFEVMVAALHARPECDVAYCYTRRYRRGETPASVPCERTGETFDTMFPAFVAHRFWHTCTPLYSRRICDRAGPWSELRFWEDVEYDFRIATLNPRLVHCQEFLADFRDHEYERLSTSEFLNDPAAMREAPAAYRALFGHVRAAQLSRTDTSVSALCDEVAEVARRCSMLGLEGESLECLSLLWARD